MTTPVQHVIDVLVDHFHELDDSDDAPFGEYARVLVRGNKVMIAHQTDDDIQVQVEVIS